MTTYLIDSGFLYGYIDHNDIHHESIAAAMRTLTATIYLPMPAITEVAYFVSKRMGNVATALFLEDLSSTDLILEKPTSRDFARSAEILRKYDDANIDFVDACLVAMAERLNITKILTVDHRHFRMFQPAHCKSFELIPAKL